MIEKLGLCQCIKVVKGYNLNPSENHLYTCVKTEKLKTIEKSYREMLEDGIENCELMRKMHECRFEPDKVEIYFRRMRTNSYEKELVKHGKK